jgi:pimeloyl-ACP methyl ester carboxylesterase
MFTIPPKATLGLAAVIERRFGHDVWEAFSADRMAADVTVPALIVHDRTDPQVDHSDAELLSDVWPGSRLLTTEGLGHNRILRDADVIASVSDFISRAAIPARAS